MLPELIEKAAQAADMLHDDIRQAWSFVAKIDRPEGRCIADKATTAYLSECLEMAASLRARLALLT